MCGIECSLNNILMSNLTDEQKKEQVKMALDVDSSYNDHLMDLEQNFDFDTIGKSYETKESDQLHFLSIPPEEHSFRVINLYKYEPRPGQAPIQDNTRRFCSSLYLRTSNQSNYLTYNDVQMLSNPGARYGVNDVMYYVGNYTTDRKYVNCRHRFIRYKYDNQNGNIVRDTTQPNYVR